MNTKKASSSNPESPDSKANQANVKSNSFITTACTALCLRIISKSHERFQIIQFGCISLTLLCTCRRQKKEKLEKTISFTVIDCLVLNYFFLKIRRNDIATEEEFSPSFQLRDQ